MTFDITLPGGIPAIDMGEGYAMADPYAEDYDAAQLAFTAARARVMSGTEYEILAELPPATLEVANNREEMAALYAVNTRDRYLIQRCLWHQTDGKWALVFSGSKQTRSQMPVLPEAISDKLRPTIWKVIEASTSPFDL